MQSAVWMNYLKSWTDEDSLDERNLVNKDIPFTIEGFLVGQQTEKEHHTAVRI